MFDAESIRKARTFAVEMETHSRKCAAYLIDAEISADDDNQEKLANDMIRVRQQIQAIRDELANIETWIGK